MFKLNLPTDIPWRRVCVSDDMLDPVPCDSERPPRWLSSIAVFRYDPEEDYQPYPGDHVSYLKIVITLAPFQPSIDAPVFGGLPLPVKDDWFSWPTYGALLQVSVGPHTPTDLPPARFPYFLDCEPKKRELYEVVSDTGEVLSGSTTQISVGKAATSARSLEDFNLDLGGSVSWDIAASVGGNGGKNAGSVVNNQQVGTVGRTSEEAQTVRNVDQSSERRELQSHTTQLTQLYNLLQAFHVGTNRIMFLLEPRPHVRHTEEAFIRGPRQLEGVQEFFLVVVSPQELNNYCVYTLLETAHLSFTEEPGSYEELTKQWPVYVEVLPTATEEDTSHAMVVKSPPPFEADPGWKIIGFEVKNAKAKVPIPGLQLPQQQQLTLANPTFSPSIADFDAGATSESLNLKVQLTQCMIEDGENLANFQSWYSADVTVHLRSQNATAGESVRRLFMGARELCCCPPPPTLIARPEWVSYEVELTDQSLRPVQGFGSKEQLMASRRLSEAIRSEMTRSIASPRRYKKGQVPFNRSRTYRSELVRALRRHPAARRGLRTPLQEIRSLDDRQRDLLAGALKVRTADQVLSADPTYLARVLRISLADALDLLDKVFKEIETA